MIPPLIPTISLLISLLFLLIRHRKPILCALFSRPKPPHPETYYTRLPPTHELEHSTTHRESDPPETPLTKYFDPNTFLVYKGVLEPPSPVIGYELNDNEEGDEGWVDRVVDSVVNWMVEYVQDESSS
ncbi:hypothetical protein ASPCADRAFT_6460 [Aspergillus carbonarius ITEM 5010]|uniref:Uncharacterized protein n=1 Tax=Aspergillus carbonarius (strain ITEM 5010) TaxID=602072 RepID=A0A1R3RJX4_ASPC5|nr:hypothetical protein ASPCADRAFT_6460 [Aspergillus carbonarius ITEM 5010]